MIKPTPYKGGESEGSLSGAYTREQPDIKKRDDKEDEMVVTVIGERHTMSMKLIEFIVYNDSTGNILKRFGAF